MSLDTILAASLLDALTQSLCVRNNYVTFTVFVLVGVSSHGVRTGVSGAFFWIFPFGVTVFLAVEDFSFHLVQDPFGVLALGQHSPKVL